MWINLCSRIERRCTLPQSPLLLFGPLNSCSQRRWRMKAVDSSRTRLENRTRDMKLDKLQISLHKLHTVFKLFNMMSKQRSPFVSVQRMSKWTKLVGLNTRIGQFLNKYPHIFNVFVHPVRKNLCCCITRKMMDLMEFEERSISDLEMEAVRRIKKLLMMSSSGTLQVQSLTLVRRELGLPENFRESILQKYGEEFRTDGLETVGIVNRDEQLAVEEVQKWRDNQYEEKWLSKHETDYSFPIDFPTGYKKPIGFNEKMNNWLRLPFIKPYEVMDHCRNGRGSSVVRSEKRVVAVLHEFLSLTLEKKVPLERLSYFRKALGIGVNLRELILEHPGIFYISTKGSTQTVFLREAYGKGSLLVPNPITVIRMEMLQLVLPGRFRLRDTGTEEEISDIKAMLNVCDRDNACSVDGDWIVPIFDGLDLRKNQTFKRG